MDSSQRSTSNLEKILLSFTPVVERIIVTPEFIDYRDEMKTLLEEDGSDRSEKTRLMAADCLLLEYSYSSDIISSIQYANSEWDL